MHASNQASWPQPRPAEAAWRMRSRDVATGTIAVATSLVSIAGFAISIAALVFAGDLSPGLPRAAGAFAISGGLGAAWLAARSQAVPVIATVQDGPGMILAALAASYAAEAQTEVVDVFVLLAITSALCGITLWTLGRFQLGRYVQYVPTTVIQGFLAGSGWLLFKGGFDVMLSARLGIRDLDQLFTPTAAQYWLPGLLLGLLLWRISRSDQLPPHTIGVVLLSGLGLFYGTVATISSVAAAERGGWLIGPFAATQSASLLSLQELGDANWPGIFAALPGMIGVAAVAAIALVLNVTGIAELRGQRLDLDRELRTVGIGAIATAPLCSPPSFHSLSASKLLTHLGVTHRSIPFATGIVLALLGAFAVGTIGFIPRLGPGALLIMLGLVLLGPWIADLRGSTNRVDQALSIGIVLAIAWLGILPGIGVGLLATSAIFTIRYSQVDPVRAHGSGHELHSLSERTPHERALLRQHGDRLAVFQLHGYLFFGSAASLERRVRAQLLDQPVPFHEGRPFVVVLDFAVVTGIEESALATVRRLLRDLRAADLVVMLSSLSDHLRSQLATEGDLGLHAPASLDEALEFAERCQLTHGWQPQATPARRNPIPFSAALLSYFQRETIQAGHFIQRDETHNCGLFIILGGLLTSYRLAADRSWQRQRRIGYLGIVGDVDVGAAQSSTTATVADTTVDALWLPPLNCQQLRHRPELLVELHDFIARRQSEQTKLAEAALATHTAFAAPE